MKSITHATLVTLLLSVSSAAFAAQVCNENTEQLAPNSRYELSDGEAKDKQTGLIWKRCMEGQAWSQETSTCEGSPIARNWLQAHQEVPEGWRLPNIKELISIVEYGCGNPAINLSIFPTTTVASVWSSSLSKAPMYANFRPADQLSWAVYFQDGATGSNRANSALLTRLVKDDTNN
ncbi:DUF1566 domain-containing protein [Leucothrix arctica]|uniref:Fimbrial protein FimH n=1 Tax=Leucothrix arctica TaxID=1481894 RepID=A0A317CA64_9GAMM|nr:DUF1566 domain-containing protein [Leucothrix arctica]PWQ95257.1 fimbrial protein FimH [Leucothrix arctica]